MSPTFTLRTTEEALSLLCLCTAAAGTAATKRVIARSAGCPVPHSRRGSRKTSDGFRPLDRSDPLTLLKRIEVYAECVNLLLPVYLLAGLRSRLLDGESVQQDSLDASQLRLTLPVRLQFHGGRTKVIGAMRHLARPDPALIKALRSAHAMLERDASGRPVLTTIPTSPYHRRLVRLAFLAPDLQRAILTGRQPPELTLAQLLQAAPAAALGRPGALARDGASWLSREFRIGPGGSISLF